MDTRDIPGLCVLYKAVHLLVLGAGYKPSHLHGMQVRGGKGLEVVRTPTSCGIVAPLLEPETPGSDV